ncbi:SAM-dependent methyltransferase [Bradyrhizobium yuanmingense]|uniref:class I SAM-dependent methyltransferase n=1 Tax=Bradyrhizobium yuanmingense TaxID=108015 RepID=UPI0035192E32
MKALLSIFQSKFAPREPESAIRANPRNVSAWVRLIDARAKSGDLSHHAMALVNAHDLHPTGHAVHAFAEDIAKKGGEALERLATHPTKNIEPAIEELVKWKTAIQCGDSHDRSKGYFLDAEPHMELQWTQIIFPLIKDLDFTCVLDLACGHGRNSEFLRRRTKSLHLVDINQSCIDACRMRFGDTKDGTRFYYHVTDGNHLKMIPSDSVTLVYSWDSMVHFDKLIVRDYLLDIARVLKQGGSAFLHHSNLGETAPDSNWATNVGTRSDMSAKIMRDYAAANDLDVVLQKVQGRAEGWGQDGLDCVTILHKRDL